MQEGAKYPGNKLNEASMLQRGRSHRAGTHGYCVALNWFAFQSMAPVGALCLCTKRASSFYPRYRQTLYPMVPPRIAPRGEAWN